MARLSPVSTLVAFALFAALWLVPRCAAAEVRAHTLHVLSIDSDDSDEQAEALTNALRSQVRATPGWTLLETTQSLSMLTAAFQCPQRPDAACLERIAEKLKTDEFVWGIMTKAPAHQVTVDLHVWTRGKPDKSTRQTFSDNLKDANDDALKNIARQLFGELLGGAGAVVVHASSDAGTVVVDGGAKVLLDHGVATLTLPAGVHTVEVEAPGFLTVKRQVMVEAGGSVPLEIALEADTSAAPAAPGKPLPVRAILGWTGVGAGAILIGVGVGFGVGYLGDQSDLNKQRNNNYGFGRSEPVINDPCTTTSTNLATVAGCSDVNAAHSAVVGEVVTFAVGGVLAATGIYLLATNHSSDAAAPAPAATGLRGLRFAPSVGPGGGSMAVLGRF